MSLLSTTVETWFRPTFGLRREALGIEGCGRSSCFLDEATQPSARSPITCTH